MASKKESLFSKIGSGLSDSIGIREGEETLPQYQTGGSRPPRTNFVRSRDTGDIAVEEVIPDPEQPRREFDEEEIIRLGESIKKHGQLQPIRVRWSEAHDKWIITAGERRWQAHLKAGLTHIRCTFVDHAEETTTVRSQQIIENVLREDLTGMELARALKQLQLDNNWSATQVAQELNISQGKVSRALALLKLPEEVQSQIDSGAISPATGYEIAKVKNKAKQQAMVEQAVAGHMKSSEAARAGGAGRKKTRKTTNETFRTSDGVRVVVSSRRDIGEQGMIDALLEVADLVRQRKKKAA